MEPRRVHLGDTMLTANAVTYGGYVPQWSPGESAWERSSHQCEASLSSPRNGAQASPPGRAANTNKQLASIRVPQWSPGESAWESRSHQSCTAAGIHPAMEP